MVPITGRTSPLGENPSMGVLPKPMRVPGSTGAVVPWKPTVSWSEQALGQGVQIGLGSAS